jgi:type IV secretion system protein VirB6
MADYCPTPGPDDPLVRALLSSVDCHVQGLVQGGYDTLFQPSGAFDNALTALLTLYVALFGYRLMLGRAQLNVGDLALTAVKLGAVVALATQWSAYQAVVYHTLFYGPRELADAVMHGMRSSGSGFNGDVFDGLQRAFNDLTAFSPATPAGAAAAPPGAKGVLSTLLGQAGFESLLLLISAVVLLLSSLGVLLACKIVLGLLLAIGPIFIAMLLFDSTRGLFEGWLRACLGFAFAPVAVTLLLGLALSLLDPLLIQIENMRQADSFTPGVAFAVTVLVMVFAGVALGLGIAGGVVAGGFRLPSRRSAVTPALSSAASTPRAGEGILPPRADRTAAAMAAQQRRDSAIFARVASAPAEAAADRRATVQTLIRDRGAPATEIRLGQTADRRRAGPRAARGGVRSVS